MFSSSSSSWLGVSSWHVCVGEKKIFVYGMSHCDEDTQGDNIYQFHLSFFCTLCGFKATRFSSTRHQWIYYVSYIVTFYIIQMYGWDLIFPVIIEVYEKPNRINLKDYVICSKWDIIRS